MQKRVLVKHVLYLITPEWKEGNSWPVHHIWLVKLEAMPYKGLLKMVYIYLNGLQGQNQWPSYAEMLLMWYKADAL